MRKFSGQHSSANNGIVHPESCAVSDYTTTHNESQTIAAIHETLRTSPIRFRTTRKSARVSAEPRRLFNNEIEFIGMFRYGASARQAHMARLNQEIISTCLVELANIDTAQTTVGFPRRHRSELH